jgi:hypothetical protein
MSSHGGRRARRQVTAESPSVRQVDLWCPALTC